jgi:hypothetical protein
LVDSPGFNEIGDRRQTGRRLRLLAWAASRWCAFSSRVTM